MSLRVNDKMNSDAKMSGVNIEPLSDLKDTVLDLLRTLKENMFTRNDEQGDMLMMEIFFKNMHQERVMQHVVRHVLPHASVIEARKIEFFAQNRELFSGLPEDRIDYYNDLIMNSDRLDDEDKEEIWDYLNTIVELAKMYRKQK